jgi:tetratricopeptide (TPR) repeat protein
VEPTRAQLWRAAEVALQAGRLGEALASVDRALQSAPDDVAFLVQRAKLQRLLGDPEKARDAATRATRLGPTVAAAHAQLGLAFLDQKKLANAESSFKKAIEFDRTNADALLGYAQLRLRQNRLPEAEQMAMDAIRANPTHSGLFVVLGDVLGARHNQPGMIEAYRRARDMDVFNLEAGEKYVAARQALGGTEAARAALEEAVARMPEVPQVHVGLARFLVENGMLDDAVQSLRRALALDPAVRGAVELLADAKKFQSANDPDYQLVAEGYRLTAPGSSSRAMTAFALAKAADDIKDYDSAFEAYLEANSISRAEMDFSMERERRAFDGIKAAFTSARLASFSDKGNRSTAPIFILGMPRSGTTLTETIISRHPEVYAAGELEAMRMIPPGVVGVSPIAEAQRFVERLKPRHLEEIGTSYLAQLVDEAKKSARVTDKMPHNFRMLGLIRLVFPNAKIVHVRRDPLDNCLSMFKSNFAAEMLAFSFDLVELGRYYNLYRGLMHHWRAVLPGQFFEVDYEALVTEPETTSKALFHYCELDWSPDVLDIEDNRREVRTMSYAQVRRPINTGSVSAAARYGSRLDPLRAALAEWEEPHS